MGDRIFKDRLYAEFATIGQALASPHRLELLDLLAQGERSVDELAREVGLTLGNTSAHLQVLRRARLVETDKRGLYVVYRLATPEVYDLWRVLRNLGAAQLAEVDRLVETYLQSRQSLEAVDCDELLHRLEAGNVTVVDVRPDVEFRQGHIAGAISIQVEDLEQRLADLRGDREIIAYCRGPYCVLADEAVQWLRRHGIAARRLGQGFPEWRAAGYPVHIQPAITKH